ncbi:MAG: menaquinone-dependent protoporphyrinogen IX dehydrogenase [Pseudomonadota bacterium]
MATILIIFSTTDGHTRRICARIQSHLEAAQHEVTVVDVEQIGDLDLLAHDKLVIGASIRYGKHSKAIRRFVTERYAELGERPNAFFTVNVVARKPNKNTPETNPYIQKFLEQVPWKPDHLGVFAGVINYALYGPVDRTMIRFIMWMTKGPTDPSANVEFTNWQTVDEFAQHVEAM